MTRLVALCARCLDAPADADETLCAMCAYERTGQIAAWRTWQPKHRERPAMSRRTGFNRFMEFLKSLERRDGAR